MNLTEDEYAVVALDCFERLEYKNKAAIFSSVARPSEILNDSGVIERCLNKNAYNNVSELLRDRAAMDECVSRATSGIDGVITLYSEDYPEELKSTPVPPLAIYYKGNRELLKSKYKFAIVGSRKTTEPYRAKAREISSRLSESGITIVTGIAEGGDRAVIDGAMTSGNLISVFAGGIDCVYPAVHVHLAEKIAENGLIISEYPCTVAPKFYTFPVRNRIIAGLCGGALILSGSMNSGTRHTAGYALDYGRELAVLPYGLGAQGELCKHLLKCGAALVENADDVASLMGYKLESARKITLTDNENKIYSIIKGGAAETDEIIFKSKMPIGEVINSLTTLEMKGFISKDLGSLYSTLK